MNAAFRKSFAKDLDRIRGDRQTLDRVKSAIENVESANNLVEVQNLKKLRGDAGAYRIRVGDYRPGLIVANDVVAFVRCLHRREIYRYFP